MSSLTPHTGTTTWSERAVETDNLPTCAFLQKDGSGDFIVATTGEQNGEFLFDGTDFILVDTDDPAILIATGSDYITSETGTEIAEMDASGDDLLVTLGLSSARVAELCHDGAGDLWVAPNDALRLNLILAGSDYLTYEG